MTPTTVRALIEAGYIIHVERSATRVFSDEEMAAAGALLVPEGSWPEVPKDHIIVGLKELPEDDCMGVFLFSILPWIFVVKCMTDVILFISRRSPSGSLSHPLRSLL